MIAWLPGSGHDRRLTGSPFQSADRLAHPLRAAMRGWSADALELLVFELRIDGVRADRLEGSAAALDAALDLKGQLPDCLITMHDLRFERAWVVEANGCVYPPDHPPVELMAGLSDLVRPRL